MKKHYEISYFANRDETVLLNMGEGKAVYACRLPEVASKIIEGEVGMLVQTFRKGRYTHTTYVLENICIATIRHLEGKLNGIVFRSNNEETVREVARGYGLPAPRRKIRMKNEEEE